jgi:hypothetical protein
MDPSSTEQTSTNMGLDTNADQTNETLSTVEETDNKSSSVLTRMFPTVPANLKNATSVLKDGTIWGEESTMAGKAHYYVFINTLLILYESKFRSIHPHSNLKSCFRLTVSISYKGREHNEDSLETGN